MPELIKVRAQAREGFQFRPRAGRFWPSGEEVTVELLDQEEDFRVEWRDGRVTYDPATTIETDVRYPSGDVRRELRPHPTRIGRSAYRRLMQDKVLAVTSAVAGVPPSAARESFEAEELAKAKARIVELERQLYATPAPPTSEPAP